MHFFLPLPDISPEQHEKFFGCWAAFYGRPKPPPHERIYRLLYRAHDGSRDLLAEVGEPFGFVPGQPVVVCIFQGDPCLICRLHGGPIAVPAHRAIDAQFFDGIDLKSTLGVER